MTAVVPKDVVVTDHVITLPIPVELAAEFVAQHAGRIASLRPLMTLRLDGAAVGTWRIDRVDVGPAGGWPLATLRRILVDAPAAPPPAECPTCGSTATAQRNPVGSTWCRSAWHGDAHWPARLPDETHP